LELLLVLFPPPPAAAAAALLAPGQLRGQAQASEVAAVSQDLTKSTQQFKQKLPVDVNSHNEWSLLEEVDRGHSGRSLILHIAEKKVVKKALWGHVRLQGRPTDRRAHRQCSKKEVNSLAEVLDKEGVK
jgi:hypothetical protein